jgi:hypothetical protein
MSQANPLWGAPRMHGELLKLGIKVAPSTVAKYLRRHGKPLPSQTWRAFLVNHAEQMASIDFFTVPTAIFRVLFVFVVLAQFAGAAVGPAVAGLIGTYFPGRPTSVHTPGLCYNIDCCVLHGLEIGRTNI